MALKTDLIGVWCESADPVTDQHTNALTLTNNNSVGTASGKVGTAGDFNDDNPEHLSRADEALLSTGDISWTEAAWVQIAAMPGGNIYVCSKGNGSADEHNLLFRTTGGENRFRFYIANFGVGVAATTFGLPSEDTWYYLQAQHDAANNKIRIRVNGGAWDEQATGGTAPTDGTGAFFVGAYSSGGFTWDGFINQFAFWKGLKSDDDLNAIYNSGNGLAFSSWDAVSGRVSRLAGIGGGLVGHRKGLI
jgi:Concanavalin A-like lectin/glucanases superfamily